MNITTIIKKIEQAESILAEVKADLESMRKQQESEPPKQRQITEVIPTDEELRSEYEQLYQEFTASNSRTVEDFVKSKSKAYLKAFCRANNLPIDTTKASKDKIADVIIQWMAQRKAITQKAK